MTTLFVLMEDALLVARADAGAAGRWDLSFHLAGRSLRSLALDPGDPARIYCGSSGQGLWRSRDNGASWERVGEAALPGRIMAVAAGALASDVDTVLFAGSEPSRVFRSDDGGESWRECTGLGELPSRDEWSFPPRPDTHHVRCIGIDPVVPGRVFVCIEAGALLRSPDGGVSWRDRAPTGPIDTHTLALPPVEGRLFAAAGDGWFESRDGGESWEQRDAGLRHHYLWSVAFDPAEPERLLLSGARGPRQAHDASTADAWIYRREPGGVWEVAMEGLPEPRGSTAASLAADPAAPGAFFAANNHAVFRSEDAGRSWHRLEIEWPERWRGERVNALAVAP